MMTYFKILYDYSIILFYLDKDKDELNGMIEELRTESKLTIQRHDCSGIYENVSKNSLAQAMINNAVEITKEEYDTAASVVDAMIKNDWFISTHNVAKKEVVTETVYV